MIYLFSPYISLWRWQFFLYHFGDVIGGRKTVQEGLSVETCRDFAFNILNFRSRLRFFLLYSYHGLLFNFQFTIWQYTSQVTVESTTI